MTRSQLSLAGKLWGLALVAHADPELYDDEAKVARNAIKRAQSSLRRLGVDPSEILTAQDAIDKACEMRP